MTGINYMGGRRNAAKARRKDSNGLVQKAHFSKLRHRILSRGLFGATNGVDARTSMISRIELAHAKKDLTSKGVASDVRAMVSASSQKATSSDAFPSAKRDGATGTSVRHPKTRNGLGLSKVLETVDLNDPIAFRATLDRIVATPDLLGIAHLRKEKRDAQKNRCISASDDSIDVTDLPLTIYSSNQPNSPTHHSYSQDNEYDDSPCCEVNMDDARLSEYQQDSDGQNGPNCDLGEDGLSSEFSWPSTASHSSRSHSSLQLETSRKAFYVPSTNASARTRFYSNENEHNCNDYTEPMVGLNPNKPHAIQHLQTYVDRQAATSASPGQSSFSMGSPSRKSTQSLSSSPSFNRSKQHSCSLLDEDDPWSFLDHFLGLPKPPTQSTPDYGDPFEGLHSSKRSGLGFSTSDIHAYDMNERCISSLQTDDLTRDHDPAEETSNADISGSPELNGSLFEFPDVLQYNNKKEQCDKCTAAAETAMNSTMDSCPPSQELLEDLFERYLGQSANVSSILEDADVDQKHGIANVAQMGMLQSRADAGGGKAGREDGWSQERMVHDLPLLDPSPFFKPATGSISGDINDDTRPEEEIFDGPDLFADADDDDDE